MVAGIYLPVDEPCVATPGEKFYIWPDPTGRLGAARLWPHLYGFLCEKDGLLPNNWASHLSTFDEATLLRGLAFGLPFFRPCEKDHLWDGAMHLIRQELISRDLIWETAFALCSNNPHDAETMVAGWRVTAKDSQTALPLPAGALIPLD